MLTRHVIGYLPSLVIPALCSLGAILLFTRLLTPAEYGHYSLAISGMMLINAVCFYWLQAALPRLMPQAAREGNADALRTTAYRAFMVIAAALLLLALVIHASLVWFAVGLGIARSLLNVNQAWHRAALNYRRYNLLECGTAVIGLVLGTALVLRYPDAASALIGLIVGMVAMLLYDFGGGRATHSVIASEAKQSSKRESCGEDPPCWIASPSARNDGASGTPILRNLLHFGLPLTLSYGLAFVVASSDRFLIEYFLGSHDLGVYAAGNSLVDRIGQMAFMAVALPSFSLTIHTLEHEGIAAARAQTYRNGVGILALGLPTCAGLVLAAPQLVAVLIGAEFRDGARTVMPWIAAAAMLNGLTTHYFDHAFHFGRKTRMLIITYGAAAALNLLLNLALIPRYGILGAAYATLASYILLLTLSIALGRRSFPIHFPIRPALKITAATALMALVLSAFTFSLTLGGLIALAVLGAGTYGVALLALNIGDARARH